MAARSNPIRDWPHLFATGYSGMTFSSNRHPCSSLFEHVLFANRFPLLRDMLLTERHPYRDQAALFRGFLVGIAAAAIDAASASFAIRSLVLGTPMPVTMS
jgi:hypothetical protein